jgi:carboxyl-terminal processing protease
MKLRKFAPPLAAFGLALVFAAVALGGRSAAKPPSPSTTDANITRLTTSFLEHSQFAHHPFDRELAGTFLDRYLDSLDGARSLFLQTDVNDFAAYRASLAQETREAGDTRPAQAIFTRYLERMRQRVTFVTDMLGTAKFEFTGHDVYSFDRKQAARPADLTAAQDLWREQLRAEYLQEKLGDKRPDQIVSTLTRRYAQQLETMKALGPDEVLEIYLDALAHVYDPHSDYMGREQMESFSIGMNLSLFGIGATLESADGYCTIRDLVPGGPAARSALLKPGDRIVAVAQAGKEPVDVMNMPLSHTVELIRGPKGTTVTLKILPAGATDGALPTSASIVRDEVKLQDQEAKARIVDLPTGKGATLRLGVIDLPSFYNGQDGAARRSATADVARLLGKLKAEHVQGIALDLRRNGGGSLEEAISLTGLFIRKGPVVQTRDQAGNIEVGTDNDPAVAYDGPLVLLTSRFSASATEILAGALQDYGRALVVGDSSTFGKGTVQNIVPLARVMDQIGLAHTYDPGALKVTISKFYRPSGASTQLRGVASDIVLPSTSDFSQVSESALKDPLPWDVVPPASYERLNRVQPYVAQLRNDSARRIAANKDFGSLAGDIARLKHNLDTQSVSLNEADRRRNLAEDKARHEERERENLALGAKRPTTYAITLENASSPGLPPPVVRTNDADTAPSARSSATDEPDELPSARLSADDIVLNEAERILGDYVDLLAHQNSRNDLATK